MSSSSKCTFSPCKYKVEGKVMDSRPIEYACHFPIKENDRLFGKVEQMI